MSSPSVHVSPSREGGGSLSVTVDSSQVRRAIVQSGCHPIGIVRATPLACGTRVRLLISLSQEHRAVVNEAILKALGNAA